MFGVECVFGIIVPARIHKPVAAISGFMDVHGVKGGGSLRIHIGQTEYLGFYQDSAIGGQIEFDQAAD